MMTPPKTHARPTPLHISIRGIAAMWVVLAHLLFNPIYNAGFANSADAGIFMRLVRFDFLAVDFFFVLSGCMLTLSYRALFEDESTRGKQMDQFYLLRLARIYPLHLFTVAIIGIGALLGMDWPHTAGHWAVLWQHHGISLISNLTLMHAWGIIPGAAWNEPAWTASILMLLYICFPNLIYITRRWHPKGNILAIAIMALLLIYALQRHLYPLGSHSDGAGAIMRGFMFFIGGIGVARLYQLGWKREWPWHRILYASLFAALLLMLLWWEYQFDVVLFHLLYPGIMLAALYANHPSIRWLQSRLMGWLGKHAFAIYMLHYPVLVLTKHVGGTSLNTLAQSGTPGLLLAYGIALALILIAAAFAQYFIEAPAQRFVKRHVRLGTRPAQ